MTVPQSSRPPLISGLLGLIPPVTAFLSIIGIPVMIVAWVWAVITSVNAPNDA